MTAELRDRVQALLREDLAGAQALAEGIEAPLYRAQALAHVARQAADGEVLSLAQAALAAASDCEDAYEQVTASAWPLRCLMERGMQDQALLMLEVVLHAVPRIERASGRSGALLLLLHAVIAGGEELRRSIVYAISELADSDGHWRVQRNFCEALLLCKAFDPDFVRKMAQVRDPGQQRKLERQLAEESLEPRPFFW